MALTTPSNLSSHRRIVCLALFDKTSARLGAELLRTLTPEAAHRLKESSRFAAKTNARVGVTPKMGTLVCATEYVTWRQAWFLAQAVLLKEVGDTEKVRSRLERIAAGLEEPDDLHMIGK